MLARIQGAARRAEDGAVLRTLDTRSARHCEACGASRERQKAGFVSMLRIFADVVALIADFAPLVEGLKRKDAAMSEQIRTALNSIGANIAEGSKAQGKKRNSHYFIAMASAEECRAWLEMAKAWGYIGEIRFETSERFAKIIGTLYKNTH